MGFDNVEEKDKNQRQEQFIAGNHQESARFATMKFQPSKSFE